MAYLNLEIWDATGSQNKREAVELPDDVQINRIVVLLVERLAYPRYDPTGGQLLSYKLHLQRTHTQLGDRQSLAQSGVVDGDVLRLIPEITAGRDF